MLVKTTGERKATPGRGAGLVSLLTTPWRPEHRESPLQRLPGYLAEPNSSSVNGEEHRDD